ncbi:MAG: hypothetical protein IPM29_07265 [Planctomycetes bacterium]|nr:hypothetical protein [Planctomycetota bacterium]
MTSQSPLTRGRPAPVLAVLLLVGAASLDGCSLPGTVAELTDQCPSPGGTRPGWVRAPARVGAWIGGALGAVVSIAALPITWPIAALSDDSLGASREEFLFAPVALGAGAGHFVVGAPLDMADYVFHRAWVDEPRDTPPAGRPVREPAVDATAPEEDADGRSP